jgi:hypothetical protein
MKITFMNEIADLCEQVGADVQEIARGIGSDRRIGPKFLHAGPGYGGSCFPKDTVALIKTAQDHRAPLRIVETVTAVNEQRKRAMARKVVAACGGSVRGKTIALLGLTFKPNTDDMREAPSLAIIRGLQDAGAHVRAYDPVGMPLARTMLDGVTFADDAYGCAEGAHALVLVTEWEAFRALDLGRIRDLLVTPILVDLRNVYRADEVRRQGFSYTGNVHVSGSYAKVLVYVQGYTDLDGLDFQGAGNCFTGHAGWGWALAIDPTADETSAAAPGTPGEPGFFDDAAAATLAPNTVDLSNVTVSNDIRTRHHRFRRRLRCHWRWRGHDPYRRRQRRRQCRPRRRQYRRRSGRRRRHL